MVSVCLCGICVFFRIIILWYQFVHVLMVFSVVSIGFCEIIVFCGIIAFSVSMCFCGNNVFMRYLCFLLYLCVSMVLVCFCCIGVFLWYQCVSVVLVCFCVPGVVCGIYVFPWPFLPNTVASVSQRQSVDVL